jgi:hypothetical protein
LLVSGTAAHPLLQANTASTQTTTISYQGHLTDNAGEPVNGDLPMTFTLYDAPTSGTAVWTEERSGSNTVPVTAGLFSVSLGSVTPLDTTLFGEPLWLGISVNGDAEMTPREQLDGGATAVVPRLLGEDTCDHACGSPSETVSKGWHPVKGANHQDVIEITATTTGRPLVIHTTSRYDSDPSAVSACGISIEQDGSEVKFIEQDAYIANVNEYGCSGSYVVSDLEPGTYTFRLMSFVRPDNGDVKVHWRYDRQIAVFEY